MNKIAYIFCLLLVQFVAQSQNLSGYWKGSLYSNGMSVEKGKIILLEIIEEKDGSIQGKQRNELYNTTEYAIKNIKGSKKSDYTEINDVVITKKSLSSRTSWCRLQLKLQYNSQTGYLEGSFSSNECRQEIGKVILYRDQGNISDEPTILGAHHWFDQLAKDLKKGFSAPEMRIKERENFVFKPIYFDYDKSEIKPEFNDFLMGMIRIVESHSDLRIRVIGHTDSDGSDQYNDGLSQRRAQSIIDYFVNRGLAADRIEIEFKGEKSPVDTNATPEGRQNNRRVDFQFI